MRPSSNPVPLSIKLSPSGRYVALTAVKDEKRVMLLAVDLTSKDPVVLCTTKQDVVGLRGSTMSAFLRVGKIEPAGNNTKSPGLSRWMCRGKETSSRFAARSSPASSRPARCAWTTFPAPCPARRKA